MKALSIAIIAILLLAFAPTSSSLDNSLGADTNPGGSWFQEFSNGFNESYSPDGQIFGSPDPSPTAEVAGAGQ